MQTYDPMPMPICYARVIASGLGLTVRDYAALLLGILQKDCIDDLVRPLRNAGWRVNVGEPDSEALYMLVTASANDRTFSVALLFSCATDNAIYRELASKCEAVLYRGAQYNQDGYAHGILVHVGPVTGWQPPKPQ